MVLRHRSWSTLLRGDKTGNLQPKVGYGLGAMIGTPNGAIGGGVIAGQARERWESVTISVSLSRMKIGALGVMIAVAIAASAAAAQYVPVSRLGAVSGTSSEEFTGVYGMRELSDGRLLVTQSGGDSRLVVLDFAKGSVESIGRKGNGPGEFQFAAGLHALGGDSTLLNAGQKRWLVLIGSKIVATSKPDDPAVLATFLLRGADRRGMLLTSLPGTWRDDSSTRVLVQRSTGRVTPVARLSLATEPGYPPKPTPRGNNGVTYGNHPWSTYEGSLLFPDGWLAITRLNPYRIDWRSPDGRWHLGAPLPASRVNVDERQKRWYMEREAAERGRAVQPASSKAVWPKNIPPFESKVSGLVGTPDGKLLVSRSASADYPEPRYDVINRSGVLQGQIVLAPNEEIRHVGVRHAYVVFTDDDGIRRIRRYPWP